MALKAWGIVGAGWGVGGHIVFIFAALYRLVTIGFAAYDHPFALEQWILLWTWVPMMIWAEGYRGFHLSFSPMVAARAKYLAEHPRPLHVLFAPIFCLGLIHATRNRRLRSTLLTVGIALLVILVRALEQPWRGIIDLGVIVGLSIGVFSMAFWTYRAFTDEGFDRSPDIPVTDAREGSLV